MYSRGGQGPCNYCGPEGTAAEKKNLVGGIKQVDVMERSVVKGGINALLDLVLY